MTTEIDIINLGFDHIGQTGITDLNEQSKQAKAARRIYPNVRDQLLEDYPWNFAEKLVQLAAITIPDLYEFDYAYQYPPDCLKVLGLYRTSKSDPPVNYMVRTSNDFGRYITCDIEDPILFYTAKITNTSLYSAGFVLALSWRLAAEMAMPVTGSLKIQQECYRVYLSQVSSAAQADAKQRQESAPDLFNSFLKARL